VHDSTLHGIPKLRHLVASRNSVGGVTEAEYLLPLVIEELTRPLNQEEQKGGLWAPYESRILFEGTLQEAEEFYNQVEYIPEILNAPFSRYTDGLPVVIPTEERVEAMLKGTSHKPDELMTLQRDLDVRGFGAIDISTRRKKGDLVTFMPMYRSATVEQVAVNAVMAGCKPEQFPVVLAIAESGGGTGDGRGGGGAFMVSGPIYKEIGMNVTNFVFGPGNPVNKALGRVGSLMWRNLGGYKETVTTITTLGSPVTNGGFIIAGVYNDTLYGTDEFYLIKTNSSGDVGWLTTLPQQGLSWEGAYSVQETTDNGFIMVGYTREEYGQYDVCLIYYNPWPQPDVKANGMDGPLNVSSNVIVSITIELHPSTYFDTYSDWWFVVWAPWGIYSLVWDQGWVPWLVPTIQYPLYHISSPFEVFRGRLPPGNYIVYFGVDKADGIVNPYLRYDEVWINVK